jgi:hypothetical protein
VTSRSDCILEYDPDALFIYVFIFVKQTDTGKVFNFYTGCHPIVCTQSEVHDLVFILCCACLCTTVQSKRSLRSMGLGAMGVSSIVICDLPAHAYLRLRYVPNH